MPGPLTPRHKGYLINLYIIDPPYTVSRILSYRFLREYHYQIRWSGFTRYTTRDATQFRNVLRILSYLLSIIYLSIYLSIYKIRLLGFTTLHDTRRYAIPQCWAPHTQTQRHGVLAMMNTPL